jgi:hypothetical protein
MERAVVLLGDRSLDAGVAKVGDRDRPGGGRVAGSA